MLPEWQKKKKFKYWSMLTNWAKSYKWSSEAHISFDFSQSLNNCNESVSSSQLAAYVSLKSHFYFCQWIDLSVYSHNEQLVSSCYSGTSLRFPVSHPTLTAKSSYYRLIKLYCPSTSAAFPVPKSDFKKKRKNTGQISGCSRYYGKYGATRKRKHFGQFPQIYSLGPL